ncbi:MAG: hypothetical protein IJS09_07335 [Treponema sp.]|nr:hypothetical protein [Treponema sp.]
MKKMLLALVATAALALAVTSCTTVKPGYGGLFGAGQAVVPGVSMAKTGEATGTWLFGVIPLTTVDNGVSTAAKNGGITKIATIDTKKFSLLGIIVKTTTIVTGE